MAREATMVMQPIWDCRWSRLGYFPSGIATSEPSSLPWVCVRPTATTVRRPVTEEECATCPYWQAALTEEES